MPDQRSPNDSGGGCLGPLVATVLVVGAFWFFFPLSIPWAPKGLDFCDRHGGFAEAQATIIDLFQREAQVACNDGTVRWVRWHA